MNTATINHRYDAFDIPTRETSPFRNPCSKVEEPVDGILEIRVLPQAYDAPILTPLPMAHHHAEGVSPRLASASLLRRIENEMKSEQYDLRTVFTYCRGLPKGSLEFQDAYVRARIWTFAKYQRDAIDAYPTSNHTVFKEIPVSQNPMAVNHLRHLMSHFGIWVVGLLGIQVWASWRIGASASTFLEGGRIFYFSIALFLFLLLDSVVWFRRRGNFCDAFLAPGVVLFLMGLVPIISLHLNQILLAAR